MRSQMASARIVSPIFSCQLRTLNWEQKMVEATLCRASMIHYTGRSTAAESLLNDAGRDAQSGAEYSGYREGLRCCDMRHSVDLYPS